MRSAEVSSAATSEVTTVKAQGQFSGHIRSDRRQSTRSVQRPHQKWPLSKHKVSSAAASEVTTVKAQGQFSGHIRSDRCQSTRSVQWPNQKWPLSKHGRYESHSHAHISYSQHGQLATVSHSLCLSSSTHSHKYTVWGRRSWSYLTPAVCHLPLLLSARTWATLIQ